MYNKNQFKKLNAKKILHKVGKSWKVISLALLLAIGGGAAVAHADNTSETMTNLEPSDFDTEETVNDNVDLPMSYENTNFQQPENDTGTFTISATPSNSASTDDVSSASASSALSASSASSSASTNFVINNNIPHDTVNNDDDINNNNAGTFSCYYVKPQKPASSASSSSASDSNSDQHPVVIPPIKSDANMIDDFRDTRIIIHQNTPPAKPFNIGYAVIKDGFNYNSSEISSDEANLTNNLYTNPMSLISPAFTAQDVYNKAIKDMKDNDSEDQVVSDLDGTFMEDGYYTIPSSVDQSIYNGLNNYSSSFGSQSANEAVSSEYNNIVKSISADTSAAVNAPMPNSDTTFTPDVDMPMLPPSHDLILVRYAKGAYTGDSSYMYNLNNLGKRTHNDFKNFSGKCHLGLNEINGHYYWIKDLHNSILLPGIPLAFNGQDLPVGKWRTGSDLDIFALKHPATSLNFNNIIDGIGLLHSGNALDNADYANFQQGHPIKFDRSTGDEVSPTFNDTNTVNGYGIMEFSQNNLR